MSHADAPSPQPIRVVVLAEVRLYREGLTRLLSSHVGLVVAGSARADSISLEWIRDESPDVILLDATAACESTIVGELLHALPHVRIVAYGMRDDSDQPLRCAERGVSAFVPGEASDEELVRIIRGSARGELLCSPRIAALLMGRVRTLAQAQPQHLPGRELTSREERIAALIADGLANKEIAQRLGIELCTVKNHVHHILAKLQVSRRTQAIAQLRRGEGARRTGGGRGGSGS